MKNLSKNQLVASSDPKTQDLVSFVQQGTTKAQQQKENFYNQLGSLIGLDLDDPIEKIAFDRVRNLENNPKVVLFNSRINGMNQRGLVSQTLVTETEEIQKPNLSKKAKSERLSQAELIGAGIIGGSKN